MNIKSVMLPPRAHPVCSSCVRRRAAHPRDGRAPRRRTERRAPRPAGDGAGVAGGHAGRPAHRTAAGRPTPTAARTDVPQSGQLPYPLTVPLALPQFSAQTTKNRAHLRANAQNSGTIQRANETRSGHNFVGTICKHFTVDQLFENTQENKNCM